MERRHWESTNTAINDAHTSNSSQSGDKKVCEELCVTLREGREEVYIHIRAVFWTPYCILGCFPLSRSVWFSHNADFHDDVTRPFLAPVRLWTTETLGPLHTYPNRYDSYSRKHPKIWNNTYWVAYSRHFQKKSEDPHVTSFMLHDTPASVFLHTTQSISGF